MRRQPRNECESSIPSIQSRARRCFLYARVSTIEQSTGSSIAAQEEQGRQFCADQGYPDPEVRIEVESAGEEKIERRVELKRILDEIQSGDVLVCRDLTRWSRDQVFALQSIRGLKAKGVTVRFWTQPFLDATPGTDAGPVDLLGIMAWAAENERRITKDRTQGNRRRLRAKGAFVDGLPPFGYTVEDRKLVIVPERAAIVRRMFEDYLSGVSMRQISARLRAEYPAFVSGLKKKKIIVWSYPMVARTLRNRLYTGYMAPSKKARQTDGAISRGEWIQSHEAIISVGVFEQVAEMISQCKRPIRSPRQTSKTNDFLLKHVAVCGECGFSVRASIDGRLMKEIRGRYSCAKRHAPGKYRDRSPCPNRTCTLQKTADVVAEALILKRLDELVEVLSKHAEPAKETPPNWVKLGAALAERRARVVRLVVNGVITDEDAARQLGELQREEGALEARRLEFERRQCNDTEEARKEAFSKLKSYRGIYQNLSIADRRELLSELAESVKITPRGEVLIDWRPIPQIASSLGTTKAGASR